MVAQPEERSKIGGTNTSASSTEAHSICFSHTDPYMSWPPLDNPAWVSNQMTTLSGGDTPLKIGNPIIVSTAGPMAVSGMSYMSSLLAHRLDSPQDEVPVTVIYRLRNCEWYTSIFSDLASDPFHAQGFDTDVDGNNLLVTRGRIYTEECMELFPGNSPNSAIIPYW